MDQVSHDLLSRVDTRAESFAQSLQLKPSLFLFSRVLSFWLD